MPKNYTPLYALYVGSREGLPFSEEDLDALFKSVAEMFLSFTVLTAEGFYLGKRLPTRVVHIATSDVQRVEELCQIIGKILDAHASYLDSKFYRSIASSYTFVKVTEKVASLMGMVI